MTGDMENAIIYLIGLPGVGKLTTAEILRDRHGFTLVDNHLANNPIFTIIGADGVTPVPDAAWARIKQIRDVLFDTIRSVAPRRQSFVLTNVLMDDDGDRALYQRVVDLAAARGSLFLPVILTCAEEEQLRRVALPSRAARMKLTNPDRLREMLTEERPLPIDHPHTLALDITNTAPEQTADEIICRLGRLATDRRGTKNSSSRNKDES